MIRTVGVTQVKYCYRMNINSVQIPFIQYAFHSNQLKAEDASKMTWIRNSDSIRVIASCIHCNFDC